MFFFHHLVFPSHPYYWHSCRPLFWLSLLVKFLFTIIFTNIWRTAAYDIILVMFPDGCECNGADLGSRSWQNRAVSNRGINIDAAIWCNLKTWLRAMRSHTFGWRGNCMILLYCLVLSFMLSSKLHCIVMYELHSKFPIYFFLAVLLFHSLEKLKCCI